MQGNVFASSLSASTIVLTANTSLNHNSYYAVVCDNGCTLLTLPSIVTTPTGTLSVNGRMMLLKNVSASAVTVNTTAPSLFEGGSSSLILQPNQWCLIQAQNDLARWNVYRPESQFGSGVTDVTYAQLMNIIGTTAATGSTTGFYRVSDYATRGLVIGGSGAAYTGTTEPLIVSIFYNSSIGPTAQIGREAFSHNWPNDVIYYDPFPQNWYTDKSFCTTYGSTGMVSGFKGVIYYRHDLKKNIKGQYDWRYCLTRRWPLVAAAAYSGTALYNAGDITAVGLCVTQGGPTAASADTESWVQLPNTAFPVSPYNNENFSPANFVKWDLCSNNYAHSGTGATFSAVISIDLSSPTDNFTFGSPDPANARNIDLGSFNWGLGETLLPLPAGGGPTSGSSSRKYTTIVNQNHFNEGSLGTPGVGFNRLRDVYLGHRAWGNWFDSAGFVEDNDTQDIQVVDRCENCTFYPFPATTRTGGSASAVGAGFRHIRAYSLVNCVFLNSVFDCDIGSLKDTWIESSSNIRIGNPNSLGTVEFVAGATYQGTPPRGFSLGNMYRYCANVQSDQTRYSLFFNVSSSKFGDVYNSYLKPSYAGDLQFFGELRSTVMFGGTATNTTFSGRVNKTYLGDGVVKNCDFGGQVYSNTLSGWTVEYSRFAGDFASHGGSGGIYIGYSTFGGTFSGMTGTSWTIASSAFHGAVGTMSMASGAAIRNTTVGGAISNLYIPGGLSKSVLGGDIVACTITGMTACYFLGGASGATGLSLNGAVVGPGALDGLGMAGATRASSAEGKLYLVSDVNTKWGARIKDTAGTATWDFFGATA